MNMYTFLFGCVLSLFCLLSEYSVGSPVTVTDGNPQLNKFIEKLKNIFDSHERVDALKEFAIRQEAEKEREINETIMAKEAEKERAVNAVKTKMALGTFLCTLSYIETVIENIYHHDVEICNPWKRDRPLKINTDDEMNQRIFPYYYRWVGFMHENRTKRGVWKSVRERIPKHQHLDFAWSMPKLYFFCKDYVSGRRSLSLERYRRLRASGDKKSLLEFLHKHSRWILLKKDLDFFNVLLRAAELDQLGYEWLDKQSKLVIPFSFGDYCLYGLPPDKHFLAPNDTTADANIKVKSWRRRYTRTNSSSDSTTAARNLRVDNASNLR